MGTVALLAAVALGADTVRGSVAVCPTIEVAVGVGRLPVSHAARNAARSTSATSDAAFTCFLAQIPTPSLTSHPSSFVLRPPYGFGGGDHCGWYSSPAPSVIGLTPDPSALATTILCPWVPGRMLAQASILPSGDHVG